MKVLVVGSGAREHALAWKLGRERGVTEVVCAPGNAGTRQEACARSLDVSDPAAVLALLMQGVFELVERAIVPKGLRLEPEGDAA